MLLQGSEENMYFCRFGHPSGQALSASALPCLNIDRPVNDVSVKEDIKFFSVRATGEKRATSVDEGFCWYSSDRPPSLKNLIRVEISSFSMSSEWRGYCLAGLNPVPLGRRSFEHEGQRGYLVKIHIWYVSVRCYERRNT